jgi:uncharacterized protein (TIGR04255 family)
MTPRPTDLPDFASPPVSEVSLSVQFDSLTALVAPHLGLVWNEFKDKFPRIEQQPPLDSVFETFAEAGAPTPPVPRLQMQFLNAMPTPRVFFTNESRTELLQVQRDRFVVNWLKVGEQDRYPRFESLLDTFEDGLRRFAALMTLHGLGTIAPNQCEVTYINHIPLPPGPNGIEVMFKKAFGFWLAPPVLDGLGDPEDSRVLLRYVIRADKNNPIGRLLISIEPAWKLDGTYLLQMTLVARGKPQGGELGDVNTFLKLGRRSIVNSFKNLTSEEMHKEWGLKE